jgi:hypothetical protein
VPISPVIPPPVPTRTPGAPAARRVRTEALSPRGDGDWERVGRAAGHVRADRRVLALLGALRRAGRGGAAGRLPAAPKGGGRHQERRFQGRRRQGRPRTAGLPGRRLAHALHGNQTLRPYLL